MTDQHGTREADGVRPARDRGQAQPGNALGLRHGTNSARMVDPIAEQILADMLDDPATTCGCHGLRRSCGHGRSRRLGSFCWSGIWSGWLGRLVPIRVWVTWPMSGFGLPGI